MADDVLVSDNPYAELRRVPYGWYDPPGQSADAPGHDPGADVPCVVCGAAIPPGTRTPRIEMGCSAYDRPRVFFARLHRACLADGDAVGRAVHAVLVPAADAHVAQRRLTYVRELADRVRALEAALAGPRPEFDAAEQRLRAEWAEVLTSIEFSACPGRQASVAL